MDSRELIRTVRIRGGFASDERAARLTATTLEAIGKVVSGADKSPFGALLPAELRSAFERPASDKPYSLDEFFNHIAAREGTTFEDARRDVLVVVSVLRDAMPGGAIEALWSGLPGEYRALLNPGAPPTAAL